MFRPADYPVYLILMLVNLAVMGRFLVEWGDRAEGERLSISFVALTGLVLYGFSTILMRWLLLPLMTRPRPMSPQIRRRIGVATTIVPGAESLEMLARSVQAMVAMRIPHDTWVLDEGDDPAVKALCERLGAKHFSRKERVAYQTDSGPFARRTKYGNYNAWLDSEGYFRYDVIVGFDPDHVPYADYLETAVGYLDDPRIGYVQLPQVYYNQSASFVARGAAEETYSYYSATQMASYTFGFPIVTGCHHVHRTSALRQVGGFSAHDADDLLIAYLYRAAGWQGVYVPEIHAKGLTPTDWPTYVRQQFRWARSVIDIKLRAFPRLALDLPLRTRVMGLLHGLYYVQEGVFGLVITSFLCFSLASGVAPEFLTVIGLLQLGSNLPALMLTELYRQRFFLDFRNEFGIHIRASFLRFVKWPYILLGVVDGVTGKKRAYSITSKVKPVGKRPTVMTPHLVVLCLLGAAWAIGFLRGAEMDAAVTSTAGILALMTLVALWTETWSFPEPFSDRLLMQAMPEVFAIDPSPTDPSQVREMLSGTAE